MIPDAIRVLRAGGYTVIGPDELDGVQDELTCGCGTLSVEDALARAVDPRPVIPMGPSSWADVRAAMDAYWADVGVAAVDVSLPVRPRPGAS